MKKRRKKDDRALVLLVLAIAAAAALYNGGYFGGGGGGPSGDNSGGGPDCAHNPACNLFNASLTTTTSTIPTCGQVGNVCTGTCRSGDLCVDTGGQCGCVTSCALITDIKSCRMGACPAGLICQIEGNSCQCGLPIM
jgi:hypothetical protein